MIKKFKNGKLLMQVEKNEIIDDSFYHDDMFFKDLYINQINGYQYIVDFNRQLCYYMASSYLLQNPLKSLIDDLNERKKIYFFPLSKKESKDLLQELENGY